MRNKKIVEPSVTITVGSRESGVTTENKKHIVRFIRERKRQKRSYRVLIVDFSNEYSGRNIDIKDISNFKNEIVLLGNSGMSLSEMENLIEQVLYNYTDGLLIIDQFSKVVKKKKFFYFSLLTSVNRTKALDVILGFSCFSNIPVKVIQNTSYFRIHKLIENINHPSVKNKLYNPELFTIASLIRDCMSGDFNSIIVDTENGKIIGCSKKEYLMGVFAYIKLKLNKIESIKRLSELNDLNKYYSEETKSPISNILRKYK